jgi:DEAD/DEAH box helicase domain-containing protein
LSAKFYGRKSCIHQFWPDFAVIDRFIQRLSNRRLKDFEIAHRAELPARPPTFGRLSVELPRPLRDALASLGIQALYSHQAEALENIRSGRHTVVSTPTSSGKSLIYNLAVAEALLHDPDCRALYLFPIKALARDQLESLQQFFEAFPCSQEGGPGRRFTSCIYDGDTTPYERARIRQQHPHVLLTNPDMLHYALLAFHAKWEQFFKKLSFVIIDEMHTYRGIFGSHVARIFRRLRRICRYYGGDPRFILLSATIGNPGELAGRLTGVPEEEIEAVSGTSGAPQAKRHFIFLRPAQDSVGYSASTAAFLIVQAARAGLKTIAFTQSRKLTELVHMSVIQMENSLRNKVSSYRAGFLPEERRSIEQRLASGSLSAVISTSALELGIDIGGLDLCILVGYPGTVMTTWQRGGRVGRAGRESAIVLIPDRDALDQYIVNHPLPFLESSYENAVIDPFNSEILKAHLPCAAAELPICPSDDDFCEQRFSKALDELTSCGRLVQTYEGDKWICASFQPHRQLDIRSVGASYTITRTEKGRTVALGKNEGIRALKECHAGAIYLHRGETYEVQSLDLVNKVIRATPANVPYFTRALSSKETEILECLASKSAGNFIVRMGRLRVTENITAYETRKLFTHILLSKNQLDLPPQTFETVGFWIEIENELAVKINKADLDFMGGIHAVEHALISMFPLFAVCDRNDIGGISIPLHPQIEKGAIFIYDGYPGGIGLAARGYDIIMPLVERTKELIASCDCLDGCPACIHSPKCGSGNKPLDKTAALELLKVLSGERSLKEEISRAIPKILEAEAPQSREAAAYRETKKTVRRRPAVPVDERPIGPIGPVGLDGPIGPLGPIRPGVAKPAPDTGKTVSQAKPQSPGEAGPQSPRDAAHTDTRQNIRRGPPALIDERPIGPIGLKGPIGPLGSIRPGVAEAVLDAGKKTAPQGPETSALPFRIGFFDLETQKLANEVGGWQNSHLMLVSVAVLYEAPADTFKVYREHEIDLLIEDLKALDLVVGFNISRFDYEVLRGYSSFDLQMLPTFDILGDISSKIGFRLSLNHLAQSTLGKPKAGDGLQAVRWFHQGEWDNLIKYCTEDVVITRDLFYHGLEKGYLVYSDKKGIMLRIPTPWKIDDLVNREPRPRRLR